MTRNKHKEKTQFKRQSINQSLLNCVPCMLSCQCALRALHAHAATYLTWLCSHVPMYLACSRGHMPCTLTCSRANMPCMLTCSCTNVPCVLLCLRANVPTCLACSGAHMPMCLAFSLAHIPTCLACLRAQVITYSCAKLPCVLCVPTCSRAISTTDKDKFSITCFPYIFVIVLCLFPVK